MSYYCEMMFSKTILLAPVYKHVRNPKRNVIEIFYASKTLHDLDVSVMISYSNILSKSLCIDWL